MSTLEELATISTEQRRIELAKLLATGVIRLLMQGQRHTEIETGNSGQTYARGLEGT